MKLKDNQTTILLVEDDERDRKMLLSPLRDKYNVEVAVDYMQAKEKIDRCNFDVVFLDLMLPNRQGGKIEESGKLGLELLKIVREKEPLIPIVVISALTSVKTAMKILKEGIVDFIVKDDLEDQLPLIMRRAELIRKGQLEHLILRHEFRTNRNNKRFIYISPIMKSLAEQIDNVAKNDISVLLTGETGTGKEVIAHEIHERSPRAENPFIAQNCAAIPEGLLESELFGHEKGAFTTADRKKIGLFELANNGTIFLDEITEISNNMQVKLLRVLQERELRRVGGEKILPLNVRVIAATNKDIHTEIKAGRFREDLYYRISVVGLTVPTLRDRLEDIEVLANHFIEKYYPDSGLSLSPKLIRLLKVYTWPGNVRELENVIQRMILSYRGSKKIIQPQAVAICIPSQIPESLAYDGETFNLMAIEKQVIEKAMKRFGNQTAAAKHLCISESSVRRKIKDYGITYKRARQDIKISKKKVNLGQTRQHQLILEYLEKHDELETPVAIVLLGNITRKTTIARLNELIESGKVRRLSRGRYELNHG